MRPEGGLAEALPLAQQNGQHQGGHTGVDVHHGAAGEVDGCDVGRSLLIDPEDHCSDATFGAGEQAAAPNHVGQREVHQGHPDAAEHQPGAELHPLGHRTADQRDGDDGERQLEGHPDDGGHGAETAQHVGAHPVDLAGLRQLRQTEQREGVVEDTQNVALAGVAGGEGHRVSPQHVDDADDTHGAERHHHHVEDGLLARQAAVEERQARGHEQNQGGRSENPGGVAGAQTVRPEGQEGFVG